MMPARHAKVTFQRAGSRLRRGLSLLELLVVIAIILILASLILGVGMGLHRAAQALSAK